MWAWPVTFWIAELWGPHAINLIRSLIFKPFQLPVYNKKKIIKSVFKNNLIKIKYQNEI